MSNTIKIIIVVIILIIVIGGIWYGLSREKTPAEEESIKIGAILPLTGEIATLGQSAKTGLELAVEQINKEGGINGRNLEVIFEDGRCDAKEATSAANKLVNVDKVPVIFGAVCSSGTLAAAPIVESGKTILFSPCSSSPDITNAGDYIFRNYPSDNFQGKESAKFIYNNLELKNVALLYCLSDWCMGIAEVFKPAFSELGGTVVVEESYEQTDRDLKTQLTKIKQSNPDIIYFLGYTEAAIIGLKQIKELGINAKILGADAWDDPKIAEEAKDAAEGILFTVPSTPLSEEFKTAMEVKTGTKTITACTPQIYDGVNIIAELMRKVGTDSTKIKDELYKVTNYEGVSGIITLDKNGDLVDANYEIKTVTNGQVVPYEE